MKPTIKDVARKAKVSVATVSRIVNKQTGYSEETRQKVLEVVREIGYTPNAIARGLVKKSTYTLGILLPSLTSSFMSELLNGIVTAARQHNYSVMICHTGEEGKDTQEYLTMLAEQQVSGVIVASERIKDEYIGMLSGMTVPVVLVATAHERYPFPYIKVNDRTAAYQATRYLIDRGHRKIGMIAGTQDDPIAGLPRVDGYKQALLDAEIRFSEQQVVYGDFGYKSGIAGMRVLLQQAPDVTAVFAASDEMAVGALSYAYQQGIQVPETLSVIGYDDTQLAEMALPPLTCVHQPITQMGQKAVEMLLEKERQGESIIMPFHITERESVRNLA